MTHDRLQARLERHFASRLNDLQPPDALIASVLDIPADEPARLRAREWFGRPMQRQVVVLLVTMILIGALGIGLGLAAGWLRLVEPEPNEPRPFDLGGELIVFGDLGMSSLGIDGTEGETLCGEQCGPVVYDAAWAPDGSRVAYAFGCFGNCGNFAQGVRIRDLVTGADEQVFETGVTALDWSPNGTRLAVASRDEGLVIIDLASGQRSRVPGVSSQLVAVSWSPDGSGLLVSRLGDTSQMVLLSLDGDPAVQLGIGAHADFSPDGMLIAFRRPCELWVMRADGTDRRLLATFPQSNWGGPRFSCDPLVREIRSLGPVWSPDGASLAAVFANRLYTVSADGREVTIVQDPIARAIGGIGIGVEWQPAP